MAGIMCQVLRSYFNNLSSKYLYVSISIEKFTQYLVTEQYCVARDNDFCPIKNCKSHIILISDSVEDILEKLDNSFYTYQTVDCLYTLFKHQFYNTVVVRKGNVFNQLVTAIKHNSELKCVEKIEVINTDCRKSCMGLYVTSYFKSELKEDEFSKFWSEVRTDYMKYKGRQTFNLSEELKGIL